MSLKIIKPLFVPGGVLLLGAAALLETGLPRPAIPTLHIYYYTVFCSGVLLAWRFHSARILFCLVTNLLAYRAMEFFAAGRLVQAGPGRIAFEAVAVLIPLNFIFAAFVRERGLALPAIASHLALLFFESVFVAVICRPGEIVAPAVIHGQILGSMAVHANPFPQVAIALFAIAFGVLLTKFLLYRKAVDSGLLWSAAAVFCALFAGGVTRNGLAYFATSGLILVGSIIENTYALAYHDELTGLPSRRAFNESVAGLAAPYSIAAVDIDHFKSFNDTHGHETGDEVLRLVARRLSAVSGGGRAYRVGGEEFSIVFSGKPMKEVMEHLEALRTAIQDSSFRVRSLPERRAEPRGLDRRNTSRAKATIRKAASQKPAPDGQLSVTVSIGVAESSEATRQIEQVIHLADKALYRAKRAGRNRVEALGAARSRRPRGAGRSIAS